MCIVWGASPLICYSPLIFMNSSVACFGRVGNVTEGILKGMKNGVSCSDGRTEGVSIMCHS